MGADGSTGDKAPLAKVLADRKLWLRLAKFVGARVRADDVGDVLQEAMRLAAQHEREGRDNPPEGLTWEQHLFDLVRNLLANRRRPKTVKVGKEKVAVTFVHETSYLESDVASPEDEAILSEHRAFNEKLKGELGDDSEGALALLMFEAAAREGLEGPAEFAKHLGVPVSAIQRAERRIAKVGSELLSTLRRRRLRPR